MATISSRNGRFLVRVRVTGRPAVSKTFNDKRSAQAWASETEDDIRRGRFDFGRQDVPTLGAALTKYAQSVTATKRGAAKEAHMVRAIGRSLLTRRHLDEITPTELTRQRDQWALELAPATVHRRMAILSHLYTVAIKEWGYDIVNPLLRVSKPKISNRRERLVGDAELEAILAQAANDTLPRVARLGRMTAARLGELTGLMWENVDLEAGVATFILTKNGSDRSVPLVPAAIELLRNMQPTEASGLVFATSSDAMSAAWRRAVKKARKVYEQDCKRRGVDPHPDWLVDVHAHDLRHTQITDLAERGLSPLELAAISGHKSLSMLSRYTHIRPGNLAKKLATMMHVQQ